MRKYKSNVERIINVIGSDRLALSKDYTALISYDIEKLLEDYFELNSAVEINVDMIGGGYKFTISGSAARLKPFNTLPKQA